MYIIIYSIPRYKLHTQIVSIRTCMFVYVTCQNAPYTHSCTHVHIRTCTHTHTHLHACTHTHTTHTHHTHTQHAHNTHTYTHTHTHTKAHIHMYKTCCILTITLCTSDVLSRQLANGYHFLTHVWLLWSSSSNVMYTLHKVIMYY